MFLYNFSLPGFNGSINGLSWYAGYSFQSYTFIVINFKVVIEFTQSSEFLTVDFLGRLVVELCKRSLAELLGEGHAKALITRDPTRWSRFLTLITLVYHKLV